jgi:hypothetical protein
MADEVIIKTTLDRVVTKRVGRAKNGEMGHIYLPKDWQKKTVQVVLIED